MTAYPLRIIRAALPKSVAEGIGVAILAPAFVFAGYWAFYKEPPRVTTYAETVYPEMIYRGGSFYLDFDLSFSENCFIRMTRYLRTQGGVELVMNKDEKEVAADERIRYRVRYDVPLDAPYGPASIRSDMEYACDPWTRYIALRKVTGQSRRVIVAPAVGALEETPIYLNRPRVRWTLPAGA